MMNRMSSYLINVTYFWFSQVDYYTTLGNKNKFKKLGFYPKNHPFFV